MNQDLTARRNEYGSVMLFDTDEMRRQLETTQEEIRDYQRHVHSTVASMWEQLWGRRQDPMTSQSKKKERHDREQETA